MIAVVNNGLKTSYKSKDTEINQKSLFDPNYIFIKGARVHNLKNVDLKLPKNKFIVFTGVSGSGKSSLSMDTLFAEGQRRYVESLSSYARQFLNRMNKPDVDVIEGICPAIAIEQKVTTRTTRSTVGSLTEIYDFLRLLYARIGITYSPKSGEKVKKHEVSDVVDYVFSFEEGARLLIWYPIPLKRTLKEDLNLLLQKGFTRVLHENSVKKIENLLNELPKQGEKTLKVLVDRIVLKHDDEEQMNRIADSVLTAFNESHGDCIVQEMEGEPKYFSNRFELDGMLFDEPTPHFFNFNNPYGACKRCEGFGTIIGVDEDLVFPDKNQSVYEGGIAPWKGEKMGKWLERLKTNAHHFDFPIHRSIKHLTDEEMQLLWTGNEHFWGLNEFFAHLEENSYKIQYRVMLSRYRGRTVCTDCRGSRLRKETQYVKVGGKHISELLMMPISRVKVFFDEIKFTKYEQTVARRIMQELENRLQVMLDVGLGYLTLNRLSNTLSGGETQRINLTRTLGSNLTDSLYILDEPSIGLHSRDTERLIKVLKNLRDLGNTVIVVEHDEDIMRESDYIVDMGPDAGIFGGEVVYNGPSKDILKSNTWTAKYLNGEEEIALPAARREPINFIKLEGVSQHNLKGIDVQFPLNVLTVVTGVSGSGKTTLVKKVLAPALKRELEGYGEKPGKFKELTGDLEKIKQIEIIDQNPLGRSSRSNPVTYIKAYDAIRDLFSKQQVSKIRGYKPKSFSFNVEGGRCENCKGDGFVMVEMQFLADVRLVCEECNGHRFKEEILEVTYNDKNIFEILELSVDEAMEFFQNQKDVREKLRPLQDIGLGYVKLGQSSSTLSGGEAQRVKLASFLGKGRAPNPILFIFDEPTTGLHFHDIKKLLNAFDSLIALGHSVLVIEHNPDVIKTADWIIDLGPEGGEGGGDLLYQGAPEGMLNAKRSYTKDYLKEKLK